VQALACTHLGEGLGQSPTADVLGGDLEVAALEVARVVEHEARVVAQILQVDHRDVPLPQRQREHSRAVRQDQRRQVCKPRSEGGWGGAKRLLARSYHTRVRGR
jgi:hypothetical protein